MSQENVDIVRAVYRAWSQDDLEALLDTTDPGVEFLTSGYFPDFEPVYLGHDGIRRFWEALQAPWDWFRIDVERVIDGEGCAAAAVRFRGRGEGSSVVTHLRQGHAMRIRDGRVVKVSAHASFREALEAVGLSE
jgi:ketosteroid isomerase-like protein